MSQDSGSVTRYEGTPCLQPSFSRDEPLDLAARHAHLNIWHARNVYIYEWHQYQLVEPQHERQRLRFAF